ncbi:hypothetical protein [Phocaeicola coprophilus]|uniref:hypothetical protein n=1 Tax=Phocaeicola coprophilus TaxID=387090 RepID=UPI002671DEB5|nr:hypothetical protein [Phocaeicola coprophilus]
MGGLIGLVAPEKNGLMHKMRADYTYNKNNNGIARILIKTATESHVFSCILHITGVNGKISTINLIAAKWNMTRVYASLICGEKSGSVSLSYKIESNNNINVYVISNAYLRIDINPLIKSVSSSIEDIESVPDDVIPLSF